MVATKPIDFRKGHDGLAALVTDAEMAAMAEMMQSHMGGQQGDMPGTGHGMMGNN